MNSKQLRDTIVAVITVWGITSATIPVEAATTITPDETIYTIVPDQTTYTIMPEKTIYTIVSEKTTYTIIPTENDNKVAPKKITTPVPPAKNVKQQSLYHRTDRYTWKEFNHNGSRLLKESGSLNVIGIDSKITLNDKSSLKSNLEVYTGNVNYDGQTWDGTPLLNITHYKGFKGESILYSKTDMKDIDMFFGIGYNQWQRDLKSTPTVNGYLEKWTIAYTKIGMLQKNDHFAWELGFKYPLYSRNRIDEFDVTVKPNQRISLFGELGFKLGRDVDLAVTYDSMKFSTSDPAYSPVLARQVLQPESTADIWGLKLAGKF